jgi:1-acyl-sn-glycerol-3-phosphate acyltransferase
MLRRALHVFFRDIEIVGAEKIPHGVPLVLVANHVNGIIDPLLVGLLGLHARFVAKSTLWSHPIIRPLLALTGAIPVYRHQDAGVDTTRNGDSFARCHEALAAGETIVIFPEGKSHNGSALAPLKTGAARIVLEAEAKHGDLGVRIVPIALAFDAKGSFRSRAVVRVGDPIDPALERREYRTDGWPAVVRLTGRIALGLESVMLSDQSWAKARTAERADARQRLTRVSLLAATPLAVLGTIANWPPYRLIGTIAERFGREADVTATYKLFAGILLFPLWWLLCAVGAASIGGAPAASVAALGGPASAWLALMFQERRADSAERAAALLTTAER